MTAEMVAFGPGSPPADHYLDNVAELVYESFAEFYDLFSDSRGELLDAVRDELQTDPSETSSGVILVVDGAVAGICSFYSLRERALRQFNSVRQLLEIPTVPSDVYSKLRGFSAGVETIACDGLYLARISVQLGLRGRGYGELLIKEFERRAVNEKGASDDSTAVVWLHVEASNAQAIAFYKRLHYQPCGIGDWRHVAMNKVLG